MSDKLTFRCGHARAGNIASAGGRERCALCYRAYQRSYRKATYSPSTVVHHPAAQVFNPRDYAPRPLPVVDTSGRSYFLAGPPK